MSWSVQIPNPLTVGGNGDVGEIQVLDANGNIIIDIGAPGGNPSITVDDGTRSITMSDIGGLAQLLLAIVGTSIGRISVNSNVMPADLLFEGIFNGNTQAQVRFVPGSSFITVGAFDGTATHDAQLYIEANHNTRLTRPLVATDNNGATIPESWHDATLQNAWTNFGAPYSNASYRLKPDGFVQLRGTISAGTKTDGTLLFTLPAAYRPSTEKLPPARANAAGVTPSLQITTAGAVNIFFAGALTTLAFDNITFDLGVI